MFNSVSTRRAWSNHLRVWCPVWARERFRISPTRFLAECCKGQLNQGSFLLLYFRFTFSDLYRVCLSVFSCTVLFVSISQVIGCEDRLRVDLYCVQWGVKLYSNQLQRQWLTSGQYWLVDHVCVVCVARFSDGWELCRAGSSAGCGWVYRGSDSPVGSTG